MKVCFISALIPIAMLSLSNPLLLHQLANKNTVTIEVTDPSGAAIANAQIAVVASGILDTILMTDAAGKARIELIPGNFDLTVSAKAFRTVKRQINVTAADYQKFQITLEVMSGSSVEVIADGPQPATKVAQNPELRTFKSPDKSFQFTYPSSYAVYTGGEAEDAGRRLSYMAVCEYAVACVVYPENEYKGTNFGAASFQVREVDEARSATACLTPHVSAPNVSDFSVDSEKPKRTINGVPFLHGTRTEGGLGHSMSADIYRAFHHGSCYELSVNLAVTSSGVFEPGTIQEFKDASRVRDELLKVADSFRFLK